MQVKLLRCRVAKCKKLPKIISPDTKKDLNFEVISVLSSELRITFYIRRKHDD